MAALDGRFHCAYCVLAVPYPNFPDKHLATPLVTPQRFLEYARASGRLEGFEPPKGVLLIYKRSLMASLVESHAAQEETRIPQLTSAYRLPRTGGAVGLLGDFGIGGPVVSILVEEHAALDVTYFFSLGLAGGLQSDGRIGDIVLCTVLAVMDELHLDQTALVGWSDGACTALILAMNAPARVAGVFFFGCNMDPSGIKKIEPNQILDRCFHRHAEDYARLSATPDQFKAFAEAVGLMQRTQPNSSAQELAEIRLPVAIVHSEHDEFIKREHAEYLARSIPGAELIVLPGVSHFAPLQRPTQFNAAMVAFLEWVHA